MPTNKGAMKHLARLGTLGLILAGAATKAADSSDVLVREFERPPNGARPRVWWHWMDGNITKEGIKLDLEWMDRVGLGGFQVFDAALNTPQVVDVRLPYMTPEWQDTFKYATTLADRLGLEEAIAGSPGWSESGGPWVPASQGMKKYVWSETLVDGGKPFAGILTHPPTATGPFQSIHFNDQNPFAKSAADPPQFYADSVVLAVRAAPGDVTLDSLHPKITASSDSIDLAMLGDGDLDRTTRLPIPAGTEGAWIQYEFAAPEAIHAVTLVHKNVGFFAAIMGDQLAPDQFLEASDDGRTFRAVAKLGGGGAPAETYSFPATTARYFRVSFRRAEPEAMLGDVNHEAMGMKARKPAPDTDIAELLLHPGARVNRFEEKAAFTVGADLYGYVTPPVAADEAIAQSDVINLTGRMRPDGSLAWTPPAGRWVVLRFGYSLIGTTNHPASAEATGLEVDKLDRRFVKNYFDSYLDTYQKTVGADWMGKKGVRFVVNDSWEAGSQNWTDDMIAKFKARRGYDPLPWMPVLTGRVVVSAEDSDRFLWDFRKTIGDLIADEHYGQLEATLHERGMAHYGESHEEGRALPADGMEVKKLNEIPMSAMWSQTLTVNKELFGFDADTREAASVAHIYGQNLAAAESMTAAASPWGWSPSTLKPTVDKEFLNGINRIVIHESAHQPLIGRAPGVTLGPFGQWFNRNETWADQAGPWIDYIARSSYLLQQGHFGADLVYFYGEDSNVTAVFAAAAPNVPPGYGFDYINADGLIHALSVADGRLNTPGGTRYRVLGLDPYSGHMSLPVLRAIHKLAIDGAVVAGPKPHDDPSHADDQAEFHRLNDELFGDGTGVRHVGKGTVYAGQSLSAVFEALQVAPDFDYGRPANAGELLFVHRKLTDGDLYLVGNRTNDPQTVAATFRISGKSPELWHAETGNIEPVSYAIAGGRTSVPLTLEPWGTVFVVFRKAAEKASVTLPPLVEHPLKTLEGPWTVSFQPGRGAPASRAFDTLTDWSDNEDPGVRYFSGTGTYTTTIEAPPDWFSSSGTLWIDLGDVKNLAEVTINGKSLGVLWHAPYRIDATAALRPGLNVIALKVTNAWVNRMIGDQQPNTEKFTFSTFVPYRADSPLLPSGLLGPVVLSRFSRR